MDAEKLEHFRKLLETEAAELREALGQRDQTAPVALDTSIGRLSRMDAIQSQQMALALKQRQQQKLSRLEKAIEAVDKGTYGRCRRCNGEIAEERLQAQPDAFFCVRCADQPRQ